MMMGRRRNTKRLSLKSGVPAPTELTATGHVLADQVHYYTNNRQGNGACDNNDNDNTTDQSPSCSSRLSQDEREYLSTWTTTVQERMREQNTSILENIQLVQTHKHTTRQVEELRDELVVLRAVANRLQSETHQLQQSIVESRNMELAKQTATQFLEALGRVAGHGTHMCLGEVEDNSYIGYNGTLGGS